MNTKEFAESINGFEYPARELDSVEVNQKAKDNGLVIIFGMSDDLLEMRGIIDREASISGSITTHLGTRDIDIYVSWSPEDKPEVSWEIVPDCPHETFNIMEDGQIFCIGAVIHKDELNL